MCFVYPSNCLFVRFLIYFKAVLAQACVSVWECFVWRSLLRHTLYSPCPNKRMAESGMEATLCECVCSPSRKLELLGDARAKANCIFQLEMGFPGGRRRWIRREEAGERGERATFERGRPPVVKHTSGKCSAHQPVQSRDDKARRCQFVRPLVVPLREAGGRKLAKRDGLTTVVWLDGAAPVG